MPVQCKYGMIGSKAILINSDHAEYTQGKDIFKAIINGYQIDTTGS